MEIIKYENNQSKILLTGDYCPNQALINEFQTLFFTCKVNEIELPGKEVGDYIVEEDAQFIILHVTIKNITNEILNMYNDDFMICFDEDGPYESEQNFGVPYQFPDEYALKPAEEIKGKIIFIISANTKKIQFRYTEYYDDESEGKTYKLKYKIA